MNRPACQSESYDVIVIGGGAAGVCAAIQAGRAGARTLLVEKSGMLGGTTTNAGVNFPGLFHAWGRQIIGGIGWEIVEQTVRETGQTLPDFSDDQRPHWTRQIRVNPFVYAAVCDEKLCDARVDVLFHTMPASVESIHDHANWRLTLCVKDGLTVRKAKVIVDCTGDANVTMLAGLPVNIQQTHQPATLSCIAGGYDVQSLDIKAINRAFEAEVAAGRLAYTDASWNSGAADVGNWLRKRGANASHIPAINARTSQGRSELELTARKSLLRLYRFLRTQRGLENLQIEHISPECGVRETVTIQGKLTVSVEDYQSGRLWDDAVCYSFYPIDLHMEDGTGLHCQPLARGVVPTIPRGALLPAGSAHFLVAGRCIASDRLANSALRVQASCMATGQAAGAIAALSSDTAIDPQDVRIETIRALLLKHQAIVPGV